MVLLTLTSSPSNGGDFTTVFNPRYTMSGKASDFKIALVRATVCKAWPNISESLKNNKIQYKSGAAAWKTIVLPDGVYTYDLLNAAIQREMKKNNDYTQVEGKDEFFIEFDANIATGRVVIIVKNNYSVNIAPLISDVQYDMRPMLGFTTSTMAHTSGSDARFEGNKVPDFNGGITAVQLCCDLVTGNNAFTNGKSVPALYTYTPTARPYAFDVEAPSQRIWLSMNTNEISSVKIWLTDQDGNLLTTGGEKTTVVIEIAKW